MGPSRPKPGARRDVYAEVTERIVAALRRGAVPWRQPWRVQGHRNAVTNRPYRGINRLVLGLTAFEYGYADPRWLTFRQALERGGHVRRGERGSRVVLWKWLERTGPDGERAETYPLARSYTVFNVEQCAQLVIPAAKDDTPFDPVLRAEAIVASYDGGPAIEHDAEAAYYVPRTDVVHLPPRDSFRDADGYYATLFHELAQSSGHPARLNREGCDGAVAFGSPVYSREELVAEFTAAFLCQEAGIDPSRLEQSAAYIAAWLKTLQDDVRLAVVAAGQAQRAADHILGQGPEHPDEIPRQEPTDD